MNTPRTLIPLLFVHLLLAACQATAPVVSSERAPEVAPEPPRGETLRVAVVSDLNGRYGSTTYGKPVHAAVSRIAEMDVDLVISAGDMVAGQKAGLDYAGMWEGFHEAVTDPLEDAGIPLAVSPGNHDASGYPEFAEERAIYAEVWQGRRPPLRFVEDSAYPLRYAFRAGAALFIALDATRSGPLDDVQRRWLDGVLARHSEEASAIIVFGHLPIHQVAEGKHRDVLRDPDLEALLVRHGVDMYVSGHHQAFYPGRRGPLRLLATSCLGGGARRLMGVEARSARSFVVLEIDGSGITGAQAWQGRDFRTPVDIAALPPRLGSGEASLTLDEALLGAPVASAPTAASEIEVAVAPEPEPVAEENTRSSRVEARSPERGEADEASTRVLRRRPEAMPKGMR